MPYLKFKNYHKMSVVNISQAHQNVHDQAYVMCAQPPLAQMKGYRGYSVGVVIKRG